MKLKKIVNHVSITIVLTVQIQLIALIVMKILTFSIINIAIKLNSYLNNYYKLNIILLGSLNFYYDL